MVVVYQLALTPGPQRLSKVYDPASPLVEPDPVLNIPYRQLLLQTATANARISSWFAGGALFTITPSMSPVSIGPFGTGPIKLSDLKALGATAVLTILGVPY